MGQGEVLKFLEKCVKPMSGKQIAEALDESAIQISYALKRLLKFRDIECIELDRHEAAKYLNDSKLCRRTRLYYVGELQSFHSTE